MTRINQFTMALALSCGALSAASVAAKEAVAPPVVRKAPSAKPAPSVNPATVQGQAKTSSGGTAEQYYAALAASSGESSADAALDKSVITAMSRLLEAGRCAEAVTLASRSGRAQLAARAQQFCPQR